MAVPDFPSFFKPLRDVAADGKEHSMKEARELIARHEIFLYKIEEIL
jgi:restriction system protein